MDDEYLKLQFWNVKQIPSGSNSPRLKTFYNATPEELCYYPHEQPNSFFEQAQVLMRQGYKTIIFSQYSTIEEILMYKSISNYQIISKKINLMNFAYINIARIYEKGYKYIIVKDNNKYEQSENITDDDILTLLQLNNLTKTLRLIVYVYNDNSLNTFSKAIFNLYSTIGIAMKLGMFFSLSFSIDNNLFNELHNKYYKKSTFKVANDYTYYDKYQTIAKMKPVKLCCERYPKEYWQEYIDNIHDIILEHLPVINDNYAVLEITNENPYYYHQFLLDAPKKVYYILSIKWNTNIIEQMKELYIEHDFCGITSEYEGYYLSIFAKKLLIDSIYLLAGAIVCKGQVYVYNTCYSEIYLSHWINYDSIGEYSLVCVGIDKSFINYYLKLGFTKIIFWNNGTECSKVCKNIFEFMINDVDNLKKFQLYNDSIKLCKDNDLLLVIDDDEFLDVPNVNAIEKFDKSLSFRWKLYGAGNEVFSCNDLSKYNYVEISNEYKTMVRVSRDITFNSNHRPSDFKYNQSRFFIKHYITKSLEDYINKCKQRILTLGELRYKKQAYQIFIRTNPSFAAKISKEQFNNILDSDNVHDELMKLFPNVR